MTVLVAALAAAALAGCGGGAADSAAAPTPARLTFQQVCPLLLEHVNAGSDLVARGLGFAPDAEKPTGAEVRVVQADLAGDVGKVPATLVPRVQSQVDYMAGLADYLEGKSQGSSNFPGYAADAKSIQRQCDEAP